jgi:hypothetical protein
VFWYAEKGPIAENWIWEPNKKQGAALAVIPNEDSAPATARVMSFFMVFSCMCVHLTLCL